MLYIHVYYYFISHTEYKLQIFLLKHIKLFFKYMLDSVMINITRTYVLELQEYNK